MNKKKNVEKEEENALRKQNEKPRFIGEGRKNLHRLFKEIKKNNAIYDESIAAIKNWEEEESKKIDKAEQQLKEKYDKDIIDCEFEDKKEKIRLMAAEALLLRKKEEEARELWRKEINDLLEGKEQ